MKQLTKTKAVYRGVEISVSSDRVNGKMVFCCRNSITGPVENDQWFATQGEAIANERHEIDRRMGLAR